MNMKAHEFSEEFSLQPKSVLQTYSRAESLEWAERWRGVYASGKRASGLSRFLWHTFSAGMYPSFSGEEAEQLYLGHGFSDVIVMSNDRKCAFRVASLPIADRVIDFYVFPSDLAWTMAFTHEDGRLGPYFAKHSNYETLVEKAKLLRVVNDRKLMELDRAKQQGWI